MGRIPLWKDLGDAGLRGLAVASVGMTRADARRRASARL
jgi:hypothetical protein